MPATASVSGEAETATGALVLRGAGVTYPGPPPVAALQPTDLAIEAGSYTAITGPSGSGKSTLLNILGLLDRPTSGTYSIDGQDVHQFGDADLAALRARRFGFVFQRFHLISSMSAAENVELGLMYAGTPRRQRREQAGAALHRVSLGSRLTHRPTELSGGEQQRVAIARAIVRDPSFLLADEPTGSLDSANATAVLDLLEDLAAEGRGIVCVTHSDEVAARATSHLIARDGAVLRGPGAD